MTATHYNISSCSVPAVIAASEMNPQSTDTAERLHCLCYDYALLQANVANPDTMQTPEPQTKPRDCVHSALLPCEDAFKT